MTHFRCYFLTVDNRICGVPAEFSASDREEAVKLAGKLYAGREPGKRHGVELWDGATKVFEGDPMSAVAAREAA